MTDAVRRMDSYVGESMISEYHSCVFFPKAQGQASVKTLLASAS